MVYFTSLFDSKVDWLSVPTVKIESFHWENSRPFRPASFAQFCGIRGHGLSAKLWSFEENPRCVNTQRDDPVYEDSCLELFLQPVQGNPSYINFEMNCKGAYLSQFGKERGGRIFLKDLSSIEPRITCFKTSNNNNTAWGVEILIPDTLISEVYGVSYTTAPCEIKGNFYKCGDKTQIPHYAAFFPAGSVELGFHNPACFGKIIIN